MVIGNKHFKDVLEKLTGRKQKNHQSRKAHRLEKNK
jgi:hypothetical protein